MGLVQHISWISMYLSYELYIVRSPLRLQLFCFVSGSVGRFFGARRRRSFSIYESRMA